MSQHRMMSSSSDSEGDDEEENEAVGDLVQRGTRGQQRHSSKIFSLARDLRMNQIYKYEEQENWTWDKKFEFENEGQWELCGAKGASEIMPTEEMQRWIPELQELIFCDSDDKKLL